MFRAACPCCCGAVYAGFVPVLCRFCAVFPGCAAAGGAGSLAGGAAAPPRGSCPRREVLNGGGSRSRGGKLKDADIFAPPRIPCLPSAAILHRRAAGRAGWLRGRRGQELRRDGSRGRARLALRHHGEKEKLRGPGAGEWPGHPFAHPDLPLEANQVRAGSLGCGCNRAAGWGVLLRGDREDAAITAAAVWKNLIFVLTTEQSVCVGCGRGSQGSLT